MLAFNQIKTVTMSNNVFDPISDLFVANFNRPDHIEPVNLRTLSSFQRALLVIDGTVTKFIEATTMEPVEIKLVQQTKEKLSTEQELLQALPDTEVLARQVLLQGKYSYRFYAYASSLIIPERLNPDERKQVENFGRGLGKILNTSGTEQYRELLWYGKEYPKEIPGMTPELMERGFLSRTYRIYCNGRPVMLINEKFPFFEQTIPLHH
jgi:chorismate-pyruvate lyase